MKKDLRSIIIGCMFMVTLCAPLSQYAQDAKQKQVPKYKVDVLDDRSINIEFDSDKILDNVLILVIDYLGNTIFMDSQRNFKGTYKCNIDMKLYAKGDYTVMIKSDGEVTDKKLSIK